MERVNGCDIILSNKSMIKQWIIILLKMWIMQKITCFSYQSLLVWSNFPFCFSKDSVIESCQRIKGNKKKKHS